MSIVGPRPLRIRYLPYYTVREKQRHMVRPGITGLAQINGRNCLNWDKRLNLDIEYIQSITFLVDVKIILNTILKVIKRENIQIGAVKDFDVERGAKQTVQIDTEGTVKY